MELSAFLKAGIPLKNALERMVAETPLPFPVMCSRGQSGTGCVFSRPHKPDQVFNQWEYGHRARRSLGDLADSLEYIGDET